MTHDPQLIVAEARAAELLLALKAAVNGSANWRKHAQHLLAEIEALVIPEPGKERLRELDEQKRAAEIMHDLQRPIHVEEAPDGL